MTRFSALGDVALTIPAIYDLCMANPTLDVVMLTRRGLDNLFLERPANLTVEAVDLDSYRGLTGLWRLMGEMHHRHHFDLMADIHDVLRTKLMRLWAQLHGVHCAVIDKGRRDKKKITRRTTAKQLTTLTHATQRYRDTFSRLGLKTGTGLFNGYWHGSEPPADDYHMVADPPATGETWVGIAPFARHKGKIYPTELMEQVVRTLAERRGYRIFLFGAGPYETRILNEWACRYPGTVSLAGRKLGMKVELAVMSRLAVMVSMDSGNMHMASLTSTPVVSVWGATHPCLGFTGWRQSDLGAVQLPLECRPCSVFGNKPCHKGDYRCLTTLKPAAIVQAIDRCLRNPKPEI